MDLIALILIIAVALALLGGMPAIRSSQESRNLKEGEYAEPTDDVRRPGPDL